MECRYTVSSHRNTISEPLNPVTVENSTIQPVDQTGDQGVLSQSPVHSSLRMQVWCHPPPYRAFSMLPPHQSSHTPLAGRDPSILLLHNGNPTAPGPTWETQTLTCHSWETHLHSAHIPIRETPNSILSHSNQQIMELTWQIIFLCIDNKQTRTAMAFLQMKCNQKVTWLAKRVLLHNHLN